jgi:hypothetical protein
MRDLVELDAAQAAVIVVWMLDSSQGLRRVYARLSEHPGQLLGFMRQVVESDVARRRAEKDKEDGDARGGAMLGAAGMGISGRTGEEVADDGSTGTQELNADTTVGSALRHSGVTIGNEAHMLYLRLLVQRRSRRAYKYLRSTDAYDTAQALAEVTGNPRVADANAFLLEKTDQQKKALELVTQSLRAQLDALLKAVAAHSTETGLGLEEEAERARALAAAGLVDDRGTSASAEASAASAAAAAASGAAGSSGDGITDAAVARANSRLDTVARQAAESSDAAARAVRGLHRVHRFAVHMCARASHKKARDSTQLWFDLMDVLAAREKELLRQLKPVPGARAAESERRVAGSAAASGKMNETKRALALVASNLGALAAAQQAAALLSRTLRAMQAHIALHAVLSKVLSDHRASTFERHRLLVTSMVQNQRFETDLRRTAKRLLAADVFTASTAFIRQASMPARPARPGRPGGDGAGVGGVERDDGAEDDEAAGGGASGRGRRRASTAAGPEGATAARGRAGTVLGGRERADAAAANQDGDAARMDALALAEEDHVEAGLARLSARRRARAGDAPLISVLRRLRAAPSTANVSALRLHPAPPRRADGLQSRRMRLARLRRVVAQGSL